MVKRRRQNKFFSGLDYGFILGNTKKYIIYEPFKPPSKKQIEREKLDRIRSKGRAGEDQANATTTNRYKPISSTIIQTINRDRRT